MVKIVMDPDFQALVTGDEEVTDAQKGSVSAGWEEVYVENGKIVNVDEEGRSLYPGFKEAVKSVVEESAERVEAPKELNF